MANKSPERQQIEFLYDVPFAVCAGVRISLGTCVCIESVCLCRVCVCVGGMSGCWLLAFGTVCEMIFHLAIFGHLF